MAEFWGSITLITVLFAGLYYFNLNSEAGGAILLVAIPIHAIVYDVVEFMQRRSKRGKRII